MIPLCSLPDLVAHIAMLSNNHHGPMARIMLGLKAIALGLLAQLLMFGLEMAFELSSFPFPSSILSMFLLFVFLLAVGCCWDGLGDFYTRHLRQPASLANRHMSIGFSVPIVMLARGPIASGDTIARIIACFITAGIVSTSAVYFMALSSQKLLCLCGQYLTSHRQQPPFRDEETCFHHKSECPSGRILGVICAKLPVSTSDVSTASTIHEPEHQIGTDEAEEPSPPTTTDHDNKPLIYQAITWALSNPLFVSSWAITLLITIPIRYSASLEEPLGISLLFALWSTTQTVQAAIRTNNLLPLTYHKLRIALSVACNPVLWTAVGLLAYAAAESHRSHRPLDILLSTLERNTTFTDLVMGREHPSDAYLDFIASPVSRDAATNKPTVGAGDVANAILSAGLVCWGLKLWEYRKRLLSSAGVTIVIVSCTAALGNVVLGPLLARGILAQANRPDYDLAFVARTVTLALGAPAVQRLGGDVGLNAAMVVVNGIMCQMALGLGVGGRLGRMTESMRGKVGEWKRAVKLRWRESVDDEKARGEKQTRRHGAGNEVATTGGRMSPIEIPHPEHDSHDPPGAGITNIVASGVTIGINAAAMGTAHLYEAGSDAAPYSALAMTVFGVATVGFTMIPQLGIWIIAKVQ